MRAKINYLKGAKIWIKLILILKRRGGLKMINQGSNQEDPKIIYMLSGLGCDRSNIEALEKALAALANYQIKYLNLPGQFDHRDIKIQDKDALGQWLERQIPPSSMIMGYSLGADLLLDHVDRLSPDRMIILDGAIITQDFMNTSIEEELAFTRQYIRANQLDMDSDTISTLLKIKFNADCDLFDRALQVPTLLLLADSPDALLDYKRAKVERHRHQTKIKSRFIANTSHDFHTERPKEIAKAIHDFLSSDF